MKTEFVPECISVTILLKRKKCGVTIGEEPATAGQVIWPEVEGCGRVVGFGERVEAAIREAVEQAEEREAGG